MLFRSTGYNNTAIGSYAGYYNTTGHNNTFIGSGACGISPYYNNTINLGNSAITYLRAAVTNITSLSDARDKTDVADLPVGLEFIRQVRPVKFKWNTRDGKKVNVPDSGFIAQELQAVENSYNVADILGLVLSNADGSRLEATPGNLIPVIVKAIKELADKNDALTARVAVLEGK